MSEIDLAALEQGFTGRPYAELIQHHLRSQGQGERLDALAGMREAIPPALLSDMEAFIDRWNSKAYDPEFWQEDCRYVLRMVVAEAREMFSAHEAPPTDQQLFDVFQVLTLSFAASAAAQPKMRTFMGISDSRLLTPSGLALLYPLAAAVFYVSTVGESVAGALGYGLANLGYVLLAAGLVSGTFKVFDLSRRWQVLLAAMVTWMDGAPYTVEGGGSGISPG